MFLRPGNLERNFQIRRMAIVTEKGYPTQKYMETGEIVQGVLVVATKRDTDRMKHKWDQDRHSLTHTLVARGKCTAAKNDLLLSDEKCYLVLTCDDTANLGISSILYLEERNDLR